MDVHDSHLGKQKKTKEKEKEKECLTSFNGGMFIYFEINIDIDTLPHNRMHGYRAKISKYKMIRQWSGCELGVKVG